MGRMAPLVESLEAGKGITPLLVALNPKGKPLPQQQIDQMNALMSSINDQKALAAVVRSWKGLMVTDEKLKANKVPTLALIGELDPLKVGVDALEGKLPNLKVVVIEGADHMDAMRNPKFVKELKAFLAEHGAAANGTNGTNGKIKRNTPALPKAPAKD
jgi:pimeloyl-ACP methyl ester carboxylesterase